MSPSLLRTLCVCIFMSTAQLRRIYHDLILYAQSSIPRLAYIYAGNFLLPRSVVFVFGSKWGQVDRGSCRSALARSLEVWPFFLQGCVCTTSPWRVPFRGVRTFCTCKGVPGRFDVRPGEKPLGRGGSGPNRMLSLPGNVVDSGQRDLGKKQRKIRLNSLQIL